MKKIMEKILGFLAKMIVKKYQPKIVGITGSIGKTSAKEAIYAVLSSKFNTRKNIKNYNNELGVPLTIIGRESAGKSPFKWLGIIFFAIKLILLKNEKYPRVLVLEMGADHPGDIEYLVKIAPCFVGVVTKVAPVHLEFFKTIDRIAREKSKIVGHLNKDGFAVLNFDDVRVRQMEKITKAQVISYGYAPDAKVRAIELENQGQGLNIEGLKFKLKYNGSVVPIFLPKVIGAHQIYAAMAAAGTGVAFGLNLVEISQGLKTYSSPRGRMNLIKGKKNSLIIDDTYNASPEAVIAAIETVEKLNLPKENRKIVVLGDMLELGEISDSAHEDIGKLVASSSFNVGVFVGQFREIYARGARAGGLKNIITFENSQIASQELPRIINEHDLILVKGSQGARMERVVKALMAEPEKAKDLLVRQSFEWAE